MPHGGKRPNSGPKKGAKYKQTIEKEVLRELIREKVAAEMPAMLDAQIAHAKGLKYLVAREKKGGKFERVEASKVDGLNPDTYVVEVWEKEPSVQAFTDLMNRTVDKPKEQAIEVEVTDMNAKLALLDRAKARNKQP